MRDGGRTNPDLLPEFVQSPSVLGETFLDDSRLLKTRLEGRDLKLLRMDSVPMLLELLLKEFGLGGGLGETGRESFAVSRERRESQRSVGEEEMKKL